MDKKQKRKKITEIILKMMKTADNGDNGPISNYNRMKNRLDNMNDAKFAEFMENIRIGKEQSYVHSANLKNNLRAKVAAKMCELVGVKRYHHIRYVDPVIGRKFTTPYKYMVLPVYIRRLKQYLTDERSLPVGARRLNALTGQVTGPDKGSSFSMAEIQSYIDKGLSLAVIELIKARGGDTEVLSQYITQLQETGHVNLSDLDLSTTPRSVEVTSAYLHGMHLENNLADKEVVDGEFEPGTS